MSIYAHNAVKEKVVAWEAQRREDYFCLECRGRVRLRGGGENRRPHFFHLRANRQCRQSGKSHDHLAVQEWIVEQLGKEAIMEHPFPLVDRIADVAWGEEKVVFEVQCSPISAWEVSRRTLAYRSCGWKVVWVMDARTFSPGELLTPAQKWLQDWPHVYFRIGGHEDIVLFRNGEEREPCLLHTLHKRVESPSQRSVFSFFLFPVQAMIKMYSLLLKTLLERFAKENRRL